MWSLPRLSPPQQALQHLADGGGGAALACRNLTLGYERHPAVHHLTADIPLGGLVAVVGPNGAGKSTLVKAIAGLIKPISGRLDRHRQTGARVAYLPQQTEMDRSFPITVHDMVAMGLWHEVGALGRFSRAHRDRIQEALSVVGLGGFGHRVIGTLSGGQFQRALFARLLLQDARLILLDEPFSSIDSRTAQDLLTLVRQWHGQQRTVVAVLHDLEQVRQHFPHTLLLAREMVAFGETSGVLTPVNLERARRMTEAFDDQAPDCDLAGEDTLSPAGIAAAESGGHRHDHSHGHVHTHHHGHGHSHPHHGPAQPAAVVVKKGR